MRKKLAWVLVWLSEKIYDTTHYCAIRVGNNGILMSCDAYGHGLELAFSTHKEDEPTYEHEEFALGEVDAALDWLNREEVTE